MGTFQDIAGARFGRLTAISFTHITIATGRKMPAWLCRCDCGTVKAVQGHHLRAGKTTSCGCVMLEEKKPGGTRKEWPGYGVWQQMVYRCQNPNVKSYPFYGGRGIRVCDRWAHGVEGFENFIADMGPPPKGRSLDRIDANGNYEPGNCRWATGDEQRHNTRRSIHAHIGPVKVPLTKYAARTRLPYEPLRVLVRNNAMTVPEAARAFIRQKSKG